MYDEQNARRLWSISVTRLWSIHKESPLSRDEI